MSAPDIRLTKQNGIGRRQPSTDYISALVCGGVATDNLQLGEIVELKGIPDANVYGITADYDTDNSILLYKRIARFFLRNPSGTLFIMLVPRGTTLTQMVDKEQPYLKKVLDDLNGVVKQAAVALNPEDDYEGVFSDGIDADVLAAVTKAQELADEQWDLHRPIQILIEGFHFNGTATGAPDLRELDSENVSVVIAADPAISNLGGAKEFYAAVEDALGYVSASKVNQCIGWVGRFPLQNVAQGVFLTAGLSSGLPMTSYNQTDIDTLHDKGYVFARAHSNKVGFYFQSSPTCTAISNDESYIERARTIGKAARLIRAELIDGLNAELDLNEDGTLRAEVIGALEASAGAGLEQMLREKEISAFDVIIDPTQKPLLPPDGEEEGTDLVFSVVPVGVNRSIRGKIKLVSSL